MATISVVTTAGAALHARGTFPVSRIEVGRGFVDTQAKALARTRLVTPFIPARQNVGVTGRADGNLLQVVYTDPVAANAYDIKEIGVYSGNTLIGYACDDAGANLSVKIANQDVFLGILLEYLTPVDAQVRTELQAFAIATRASNGAVRLVPNASSYTQEGAFVLSPKQIQDLIEGVTPEVGKATSADINTGTDDTRFITSDALFGSRYKQFYVDTQKPTQSQINAMRPGSIWIVRNTVAEAART